MPSSSWRTDGTHAEVQPGTAPRENAAARVRPFAIDQRQWRGEGKPETFDFLGFTHICGKKRSNGRFTVLRQTMRKRLQTKLNEVKAELQRRMHEPIPEARQVAAGGCGWTLPLLRGAHEPTGAGDFSVPSRLVLASLAVAAEPERPGPLGSHAAPDHSLAAFALCLSSLSSAAHGRCHLRQEPDAGNPLVRIRGGGHEQS